VRARSGRRWQRNWAATRCRCSRPSVPSRTCIGSRRGPA
jgi:hypothetical protein